MSVVGILKTDRIQLASLDGFANMLGYSYNGTCFEDDTSNLIKFNRMVELHNGHYFSLREKAHRTPHNCIRAGNNKLNFFDVEDARGNNLVEKVKLQKTKKRGIITQSHIIKAV